jgi:hypothetical protein
LITTRYWSIMIATLMEYPAHTDPQSNYWQQPMTLI